MPTPPPIHIHILSPILPYCFTRFTLYRNNYPSQSPMQYIIKVHTTNSFNMTYLTHKSIDYSSRNPSFRTLASPPCPSHFGCCILSNKVYIKKVHYNFIFNMSPITDLLNRYSVQNSQSCAHHHNLRLPHLRSPS